MYDVYWEENIAAREILVAFHFGAWIINLAKNLHREIT